MAISNQKLKIWTCFSNMGLKYCLIFISVFSIFIAHAQVNVHHVTESFEFGNKQGLFYALPRTLIKVDICVEKTEFYSGPYSEYAAKYLDLDDVVTSDYNEYLIKDIKLSPVVEPDPNHFYFVEFDEKTTKEEKTKIVSLSKSGLIIGLNGKLLKESVNDIVSKSINADAAYDEFFQYYAETNLVEQIDTIIKKVVVDTLSVEKVYFDHKWVEKGSEQKALDAANMITKIRDDRYNLLTGYQEIAYDAGSMAYMSQELSKMEKEYLSLFIGINIKKNLNYSFTVLPDPEKESLQLPVFVYSERGGIKDVNSAGGEKIFVRIEKSNEELQIFENIKNREQTENSKHGFYYRIPISTNAVIEINNDFKVRGHFYIPQYGVVTYLSPEVSVVQFHPETGALKSVIVE